MDTLTQQVSPGARQERRRRRALRRRLVVGGAAGGLSLALLIVALTQLGDPAPQGAPAVGAGADGGQVTYLLVGTRAADDTGQADWITLLAVDRAGRRPVTIFVPTATLVDIPGFGYDAIGKAMALGRVPLQEVTVENLLGVQIDHALVVPEDLYRRLVDGAGGLDVTIPARLMRADGPDRLVPVFQPGRRHLDGATALRYLQFRGAGESELARLVRQQQLWEAVYARFAGGRSAELALLAESLGASLVTDASPADVGALLAAFAAAPQDGRLYRTLPVEPVGSGGAGDAFRPDPAQIDELVGRLLADSRPPEGPGRGARVQILNGNGQPEVGLRVAGLLVPAGFQVADTGNASSFSFPRTRIIVYRDQDVAIAERVRELLGVGVIEIGRTGQTIVQVTIVVGKDFRARES